MNTKIHVIKTRVLLFIAIALGSLSGAIFWINNHKSSSGLTIEQANKIGFASVSDYETYYKSEKKMYNDQYQPGGLDNSDLQFIRSELSTESGHSGSTIMNLCLAKPNQQPMLVECLGTNRITSITHGSWLYLFQQWIIRNHSNRSLITPYTLSRNPDIAAIAREALNGK